MSDPIIVQENAIPSSLATAARYVLTAIGGLLVAKGYFSEEILNHAIGILLMLLPGIYGIYRTVFLKRQLVTVAAAAPNDVAVVK